MSSKDVVQMPLLSPISSKMSPESFRRRPLIKYSPEKPLALRRSPARKVSNSNQMDDQQERRRHQAWHPNATIYDRDYPVPPPTPPGLKVDRHLTPIRGDGSESQGSYFVDEDLALNTPVDLRSPPTPEITPPRVHNRPGSLQPPPSLRALSSRTESFTTAREEQWSSDDDTPPLLGTTNGANNFDSSLQQARLDLEKHFKANTSDVFRKTESPHLGNSEAILEGNLEQTKERIDQEWVDESWKEIGNRRSNAAPRAIITNSSFDSKQVAHSAEPRTLREISRDHHSLRDRIQKKHATVGDATLTDSFARQILWPFPTNDADSDDAPHSTDTRRFSSISGSSSTVVEAMIFDETPLRKRRPLRHKEKTDTLRTSVVSMRSVSLPLHLQARRHELVHKTSGMFDLVRLEHDPDHDKTTSTESRPEPENDGSVLQTPPSFDELAKGIAVSASTGRSILAPALQETHSHAVPTKLVRHNRLYAHGPSSKQSRVQSDLEPTPGYFDIPKRRRRTMSESNTSALRKGIESRRAPPIIPPRSSSLSAPTSRNESRTTSITSASAGSGAGHRRIDQAVIKARSADPDHHDRSRNMGSNDIDSGSLSLFPATPTPHTPFSPHSTPGALELSEARAITIFPHNNDSLLVVQQASSRPSSHEYFRQGLNVEPSAPPPSFHRRTLEESDSPPRYPRPPPEPPAFQIIPPTPDVRTPSTEVDRQPARTRTLDPADRPWPSSALSIFRRALSKRRYSESFVSAFATRREVARAAPTIDVHESRLSPFWLPRGFWDDVEVDDEDIEDEFLERGRCEILAAPRVGRRISYPKEPRDVLGGDRERDSVTRRVARYSHGTDLGGSKRKVHTIPALGVQIEFIGFPGVGRRLRQVSEEWKERQRERERARIKGRISPPRFVEGGVI